MKISKHVIFGAIFLLAGASAAGQSGGDFRISQSVIASGGESNLAGGAFTVGATAGQPLAGTQQGGAFNLQGGFWITPPLAPTAARVAVGGKVLTADGAGIRNVTVILTDAGGATRTTFTGTFGFYRFENIEVGATYMLTVRAKRYVFASPTRIVSVTDELTDLDFVAEPR